MMAEEEPRINPATGISGFVAGQKKKQEEKTILAQVDEMRKKELDKRDKELQQREKKLATPTGKVKVGYIATKIEKQDIKARKEEEAKQRIISPVKYNIKKGFKSDILKFLGARRKGKRPMQDRLKVLRLQNMLDKKRLQNQIERLKLAKKVELLRKQGKLKQTIQQPIIKPRMPLYPAYATPEVIGDIDSVFNADINGAKNDFWGNEEYYNEDFYTEDYYGGEFSNYPNNDPLYHLAIKIKYGVSPLLW